MKESSLLKQMIYYVPILPFGMKVINICTSSLAGTSPVASPLPSFFQEQTNSAAICATKALPRFWESKHKNHPPQQWLHLRDPRGTLFPPICIFAFYSPSNFLSRIPYFCLYFQNLRGNMIIPLENQPSMICLGAMGNPDPTSIINLETSRIPIKSSDMNLDWSQAFKSWPSVTPGWRNWFRRIANVQRTN